jgi:hypothetical protein
MRVWPPIVWVIVYVASELILMGSAGRPGMLVAGGVLAVVAWAIALRLALGYWEGRPRPRWFWWAIASAGAVYVLVAVAAAYAGTAFAVAALAAGGVPMTALTLLLALARSKTLADGDRLRDLSTEDDRDSLPGIGMRDEKPPRLAG